jgi:hypothetical protein
MQRRVGGFVVLFIHEVHKVRARLTEDFEAAFRDTWMPMLAETDDARLLIYANQCQGSGSSCTVVTLTGIQDGAAWERLSVRLQTGDLQKWMRSMDDLRHEVEAKLLVPLPWSPLQETSLPEVPVDGREHEMRLYLEDTMWPYQDKFEEYVDRCGEVYARSFNQPLSRTLSPTLPQPTIQAAFQPALGCHLRREVTLVQRIERPEALMDLLRAHIPPIHRAPGTWMHDALDLRHQWRSRLLRTAAWSPIY